jgi:type I restriction enzyme, S subunit
MAKTTSLSKGDEVRWQPLKHLVRVSVSNVDKKSDEFGLPVSLCNYTDVYNGDRIRPTQDMMRATATPQQVAQFRLNVDDVIITKDSETAEDIGVAAYVEKTAADLVCGYHLAILRPRPATADGRFVYWAMQAASTRGQLAVAATGVTRYGLRTDAIGSVSIPTPAIHEQRAIAGYLDSETARIDALIVKKRRMIELLSEHLRSSVHAMAVDRFGNHVGTPDFSGKVVPLKRVATKLSRPAVKGAGTVTAYRDGQVTARSDRRIEGYTMAANDFGYQGVCQGDLVIHGLDSFAGAVGVAEANGNCSQVYHVCGPVGGVSNEYTAWVLRALADSRFLELQAGTVRQRAVDLRNWATAGQLPIPIVSSCEQEDLVRRISSTRAHASTLAIAIDSQLQVLLERRKALITAVVTGELAIPGVTA